MLLMCGKEVCKSNESFIADPKSLATSSPLGCYLLNLFKFISVPFEDEWVDTEGGVIIIIWNGKTLLIRYFEEVKAVCSKSFNDLKDDKLFLTQTPLVNNLIQSVRSSIIMICDSQVMLITSFKIFHVNASMCA